MEKTPHHLVQIVDNNTKNSNLLRLPGEIRNMIWALAMGGNYVRVKRVIHNITGNKFWVKTKLYAQATLTDNTLRSSGFKLPQVCRQIYAETATLGYKLNTFILEHNNWPKEAIGHLLLAQKDAVESILLEMTLFESYISSNVGYSIRSRYPNLKRIEVPDCAFGFKQFPSGNDHWMNASTHGWWWEWAIEKIQQKEGQNIEIIFYS
ncbi:hypothetical protein BKA66DRAFT_452360 [Pyrenochaeta sp. MPI-SDFR-AT-0127]|nr:hypothetical protein BKA66DRAFT_452360 [Pyrenochaeta sp. MPI-SDFR-AT-0127]